MFYSSSYLSAETISSKIGDLIREYLLKAYLAQIKAPEGGAEILKVCIGKTFWNKNVNYRKTDHFCFLLCGSFSSRQGNKESCPVPLLIATPVNNYLSTN